eukprot:11941672-Heterocapsa_arctica.AAC.1
MVEVGKPWGKDVSSTTKYRGAVKVYTDGGAAHPADPRLRRAGCGIWVQEGVPQELRGGTRN